ncbi:lytic transglycosylase domain-containing protein [Pseudoduganella umbonata]|nr:lytic transglycosylase domain-containing protein [Pseudoduganella umbonata]MBB3221700.1 soluble lytic murein transglycosylase-like protein [Pseudoduganella umbonata]
MFALFSGTSLAADLACIEQAAARFDVPTVLLRAIVQQETAGRCTTRHPRNRNGTYDIGCAGINSGWLPRLSREFGINEQALQTPCTNLHVGAWILARNLRQHGDTWRAIGAYNAVTESKRREYAWKILAHMQPRAAR